MTPRPPVPTLAPAVTHIAAARIAVAPFAAALFALALVAVFIPGRPALAQPSQNMTLLGHLNQHAGYSSCWGYTAPDGTELAIIGTTDGAAVVDATDPGAPVEVLFVPGPQSIWREMKTYDHYAYIVTEGSGGGLKIVDLADPRHPALVTTYTGAFSTCHTVWIDTQHALAYCNGTNNGLQILSLANPAAPTVVANWSGYYVHDCYVRDGRCYAAAIYNGFMAILDVSNLPVVTELGRVTTPGGATHNTWLTRDGRYCLTTDETGGGHISIFDVANPASPTLVSQFIHPASPGSSVHNVTVLGDLVPTAWYINGVEVIDVANPLSPRRAGWYDTFSGGTGLYDGVWGVYPFAANGSIYASDMSTGLYILRFTPASLRGTVRDAVSAAAIPGASVSVPSALASAVTDSTGGYRVSLTPGTYTVVVSGYGFHPDTLTVALPDTVPVTRDVSLDRWPSGSVSGVVRAFGSGLILPGAPVSIAGAPATRTTGADGSYSFPVVLTGSEILHAEKFGYVPADGAVYVQEGRAQSLSFSLRGDFFADDAETDRGWTLGVAGDDATSGQWVRANPVGTGGGSVQPEDDHSPDPGVTGFVTGNGLPGGGTSAADVDGGKTTLLSPAWNLTGMSRPALRLFRWYSNDSGPSPGQDTLKIDVSANGTTWVNMESLVATRNFWEEKTFYLSDYVTPSAATRLRVVASDYGGASIVEAAVDDIEIYDAAARTGVPGGGESGPAATPAPAAPGLALAGAPNPFPSATSLRFELPGAMPVLLDIYGAGGRRVRRLMDARIEAGAHEVRWDGRDDAGRRVGAGIYLARLLTPARCASEKLVFAP